MRQFIQTAFVTLFAFGLVACGGDLADQLEGTWRGQYDNGAPIVLSYDGGEQFILKVASSAPDTGAVIFEEAEGDVLVASDPAADGGYLALQFESSDELRFGFTDDDEMNPTDALAFGLTGQLSRIDDGP